MNGHEEEEEEVIITDFCESDPDFAVICSFLDKFGTICNIQYPSIAELEVNNKNSLITI